MIAHDKRFLSERSDEGGSVRWAVDPHDGFKNFLTITDCSEVVSLDFYIPQTGNINKHVEKKVAKLDNLIESLQLFRKELLKCKVKPKQY